MKTTEALNQLLADLVVFNQKLRNFHWNLSGHNFFALHEKLDDYYEKLSEHIDLVAERVRKLSEYPDSKLSVYLDKSNITESDKIKDEEKGVEMVIEDTGSIIDFIHASFEQIEELDAGTEDMLIEVLRYLEKQEWMFGAWLDDK
jgi:starvation-inducible DNA-binding protein